METKTTEKTTLSSLTISKEQALEIIPSQYKIESTHIGFTIHEPVYFPIRFDEIILRWNSDEDIRMHFLTKDKFTSIIFKKNKLYLFISA